jgi:hypothetical protein
MPALMRRNRASLELYSDYLLLPSAYCFPPTVLPGLAAKLPYSR